MTKPAETPHVRRCLNVQCRVETYQGAWQHPLTACPVCLNLGVPLTRRPAEPDLSPLTKPGQVDR